MSDFRESLSRIRAAVKEFQGGSADDFGRRVCYEILDPLIAEVEGLSRLGETTASAERACQGRIDEADQHKPLH